MDLVEAWRFLAEKYEESKDGFIWIESNNEYDDADTVGGICNAAKLMRRYKMIEDHHHKWMMEAIAAERKRDGFCEWSFLWPLTKDGGRERAAFCRREMEK